VTGIDGPYVEYGYRITWPDGYSEVKRCTDREEAERKTRFYNANHDVTGTADTVTRLIGAWGSISSQTHVN
jgi:hypothetical protein